MIRIMAIELKVLRIYKNQLVQKLGHSITKLRKNYITLAIK